MMTTLGCQMLAAPGHKGLLGPLGPACCTLRPGKTRKHLLPPAARRDGQSQSGSGYPSRAAPPYKFEAGSLNVPGILGVWARPPSSCSSSRVSIACGNTRWRLRSGCSLDCGGTFAACGFARSVRTTDRRVGVVSTSSALSARRLLK